MSTSLRTRLGPPLNELDAVRSLHRRMEVATADDHVQVVCATCYILGEGWPCTVARFIEVIDAQIESEQAAPAAVLHSLPDAEGHVLTDLDCWCRPYRDRKDPEVVIHRRATRT